MKTSINLLKQYGNIDASDEKIIQLVKDHIGEVESTHDIGEEYKNITIAQVVEKETHPDSEKLGVYKIDIGGDNHIQVVAGDRELPIGAKVAYLAPGATVPSSVNSQEKPFVIKAIKLRGVESHGMLGSARELNIGNDHNRVLILEDDAPVGEPFAEYYDLNDVTLEIENKALTNRGDLFGILGLSRELTAITGNPFTSPTWYNGQNNIEEPNGRTLPIKVINDAEITCPRYCAVVLENVTIKESPVWLKSALIKSGIRPINNMVDITNYISILFGQPLHAFDYDKIINNDEHSNGEAIVNIRMAKNNESMLGLDDKTYTLDDSVMVIADSLHPIAIAGIIGGQNTEVDSNTTRVILEAANFEKTSIRRTSMKLGIFTDAATRFKRALDLNHCMSALSRAIDLGKELTGSSIASRIIDIKQPIPENKNISLDLNRLNTHLGLSLTKATVKNILTNLEYKIIEESDTSLIVEVPSWRPDVSIREDIHEDIGRVYGFNNIPLVLPEKQIDTKRKNKIFEMKKSIRQILSGMGGYETLNYSFVDSNLLKRCNLSPDSAFKLKNPLSPELSLMRTSLLPSLLLKGQENIQRGFENFMLYELNIFHNNSSFDQDNLPEENWYLSAIITERNKTELDGSPYYTAKYYLERLLNAIGRENITYDLVADHLEMELPTEIRNVLPMFDPNTSAIVSFNEVHLGIIGELKEEIKGNFKLPPHSAGWEINITELSNIVEKAKTHKETPIYPFIKEDICFEIDKGVKYSDIETDIKRIVNNSKLMGRVECLDIYSSKELVGKKRITYRIVISHYEKTLSEKDIQIIKKQIEESISKKYNAILI